MANSYVEYTTASNSGTGTNGLGQKTFTVPTNFININDIVAKGYNGSAWTELTIASRGTTTVELSVVPTGYATVRFFRRSSTEPLVDFQTGATLSESDLDTAYRQGLYVAQEVAEDADPDGGSGISNISNSQLAGGITQDKLAGGITNAQLAGSITTNKLQLPLTNFSSTGIDDNADATAITIDSSERGGIGTNSPSNNLHIQGSSGLRIVNSDDTSNLSIVGFDNNESPVLNLYSNNAVTAKIHSEGNSYFNGGNLLVGTTSSPSSNSGGVGFVSASAYGVFRLLTSSNNTATVAMVQFENPNGTVGSISMGGSSTAYNTSSDHRLKENVDYTFDATTRLKQLKPARFNFIADADTTVDGFLAHEVQSVVPEAISGTHNEVDDDGNPVYQGIDQSKLVPLLVKTIQELEARITTLENA